MSMDQNAQGIGRGFNMWVPRWFLWATLVFAVAILIPAVLFPGPTDGVEEGKTYGLAKTFPVKIEVAPGRTIPGRQFDLTDRGVGIGYVIVSEKDTNGIVNNFREDGSIPASSVRKDRVKVLGRTIEGTNYPGYEFLE